MVFREFVSNRNEPKKVKMNKPVYLDLPILEICKTLMHEFWYNCIKPKYQNKAKLCYMDIDNFIFIVHIRTKDVYNDIADDVKNRYDIKLWN